MSDRTIEILDSFIEYAEKTKRFHDVGNFQDIKERINELQKQLAESVPKQKLRDLLADTENSFEQSIKPSDIEELLTNNKE